MATPASGMRFSSKGMELPINVLVTIVFLIIVMVAIVLFVTGAFDKGGEDIDRIGDRVSLCKVYAEAKCAIRDVPLARNPDLASSLENLCKKEGMIDPESDCVPFDEKCGKPCCQEFCAMFP